MDDDGDGDNDCVDSQCVEFDPPGCRAGCTSHVPETIDCSDPACTPCCTCPEVSIGTVVGGLWQMCLTESSECFTSDGLARYLFEAPRTGVYRFDLRGSSSAFFLGLHPGATCERLPLAAPLACGRTEGWVDGAILRMAAGDRLMVVVGAYKPSSEWPLWATYRVNIERLE
jgi:hypothetical protein